MKNKVIPPIFLSDFADKSLVHDEEFFVIITGYMMSRYGQQVFEETPILF